MLMQYVERVFICVLSRDGTGWKDLVDTRCQGAHGSEFGSNSVFMRPKSHLLGGLSTPTALLPKKYRPGTLENVSVNVCVCVCLVSPLQPLLPEPQQNRERLAGWKWE